MNGDPSSVSVAAIISEQLFYHVRNTSFLIRQLTFSQNYTIFGRLHDKTEVYFAERKCI